MTELARLDALGGAGEGRSFAFRDPVRVVVARTANEVVPALREVEQAVAGGLHAAGFVAYEAAAGLDAALAVHAPDPGLPLLRFTLFAARDEAPPLDRASPVDPPGPWVPSLDEAAYAERVARIRELIAAGDTYQVNFTFPLRSRFAGDDAALYARLCRAQRAGFCAFLRFDDLSVLSASPELFFRRVGDALELRPMKGTRPRGRWPAEDDSLAAELLASPKERAENLMIVDLLRNDAGRISAFGTVQVPRLFETERYETVHQLTSTIRSQLRPDVDMVDVFRALFPCGSVTGAPKVRTSQIIAELEDGPRGVYCGAIGFVSPGEAVFSVAIRTLVLDRRTGDLTLGVGSGITADSHAEAEFRECLAKAEFARRAPYDFRLLETMLWEPSGGVFLLRGHLERMRASARHFGFRWDEGRVRRWVDEAVASSSGDGPLRIRLLLSRDGGVATETYPLPKDEPTGDDARPLRVAFAAEPVDSGETLLFHKTTAREIYRRRGESRPDCDDVLLINERGEVTEGTVANVVVRMDGALWTPPLESGLLPGVFRAELLRTGEVRERVLNPEDVVRADELWLINSVRKWKRATLVA